MNNSNDQLPRANPFVPLDPETDSHDMLLGPCKCGAWRDARDWVHRSVAYPSTMEELDALIERYGEPCQPPKN